MRKHRLLLSALLFSLLTGGAHVNAQITQPDRDATTMTSNDDHLHFLTPESMPKSVGYSQVATVTGGTLVFISGQVAMDRSGSVVGKDNFRAQVEQVFDNLKAAVEAAGGHFSDVIKLNSYLLDFAHLAEFREVRDKYVNLENPPVSTAVQVSGLFRPELLVEIEAVAVVKRK
jgi:2-iminobutanoate/2-iminopropanoate deaminase